MQIAINHDPTDPTENRCHRFLWALHDVNYNVIGVVGGSFGIGELSGGGALLERYAYTPYGQRQVFGHGWNLADLNGDGRVDQLDLDIFDVEYYGLSGDDAQPGDLDADGDTDLDDRNRLSNALGENHDHDPHLLTPRTRSARVEGAGGGGVQQPYGLCRIGHQGLAHDEETGSGGGGGLIYNRARMRSVQLGRFLQRDPLGYVDGMSVYAYYAGLRSEHDPSGRFIQIIAGAVAGAGLEIVTQVSMNVITGEDAFDIDLADVAISATIGGTGVGVLQGARKAISAVMVMRK